MNFAVTTLFTALCCVAASIPNVQAKTPKAQIDGQKSTTVTIRIPKSEVSNSGHTSYVVELLTQALEHSKAPQEVIQLEPIDEDLTQARLISELQKGDIIDLIWTMTSKDREVAIRPIRVPILKGLLGQRVFLIRTDQQPRFSRINTLSELAELVAGQGSHWPDTNILRANGLPVLTSPHYELLFNMLKGERFQYFPRGLNEAWAEIEAHPDEGLMVEQHLLLSYPAPMYFFVKHGNEPLAKRLEIGLEAMIQNGSFDKLFSSHPSILNVVERAHLENRKIFKLVNPSLPSDTPLDKPNYWLKVD